MLILGIEDGGGVALHAKNENEPDLELALTSKASKENSHNRSSYVKVVRRR